MASIHKSPRQSVSEALRRDLTKGFTFVLNNKLHIYFFFEKATIQNLGREENWTRLFELLGELLSEMRILWRMQELSQEKAQRIFIFIHYSVKLISPKSSGRCESQAVNWTSRSKCKQMFGDKCENAESEHLRKLFAEVSLANPIRN